MSFIVDLVSTLGKDMVEDDEIARDVYAALSNIEWRHPVKGTFTCSFRHAGSIVATITDRGDYLNYYCSKQEGIVTDYISNKMYSRGWTWSPS